MGNVIGSNIFNILLILGVSTTIHPIGVNLMNVYDMIILLVVNTVVLLFCCHEKRVTRIEGIIMVLLYAGDMVFAVMR